MKNRCFSLGSAHKTTAAFLVFLMAVAVFARPVSGQIAENPADEPSNIGFDNILLTDALRQLAYNGGVNLLLDSKLRLNPPFVGANGQALPEPKINCRWTNVTEKAAINRLLKLYGLTTITNPATPIVRIVSTNRVAKPFPGVFTTVTNGPMDSVALDDFPLEQALRQLALNGNINISFDPALHSTPPKIGGISVLDCQVKERWRNITAAQAITALLDNYDLSAIPLPTSANPTEFKIVSPETAAPATLR